PAPSARGMWQVCGPGAAQRAAISLSSTSASSRASRTSSSGTRMATPLGPNTPGMPGRPLSPPSTGWKPCACSAVISTRATAGSVTSAMISSMLTSPAGAAGPSAEPALDHQLLGLGDRLGRIQPLRAGLGAVHDGVAAVELEWVLEIVEPL